MTKCHHCTYQLGRGHGHGLSGKEVTDLWGLSLLSDVKLQSRVYLLRFLRAEQNNRLKQLEAETELCLAGRSISCLSCPAPQPPLQGKVTATLGTSSTGCLRCQHSEASAWHVRWEQVELPSLNWGGGRSTPHLSSSGVRACNCPA